MSIYMNQKKFFAPCAVCGKPVYKPIFDVWPWQYTKDGKAYWFCGEKHKLQWLKEKDIQPDSLDKKVPRKRICCKEGVETVREIRKRKGIRAKTIYTLLGLSKSAYAHMETGMISWHKEWLPAIAQILGEPVDYIKWQSVSVPRDGIIFPLELTEENMPKETKKRKPYHEHYYITKIDTGRKTLVEVLEEKDVAQKELAFKLGLKLMKLRACIYGHNAWPRSIVDKICKILEIKVEDVKWERINEGK